MKDKDGFTIRCKHSEWRIINDQEDQDFVCDRFGTDALGYHMCFGDEFCRYYEPNEGSDNG